MTREEQNKIFESMWGSKIPQPRTAEQHLADREAVGEAFAHAAELRTAHKPFDLGPVVGGALVSLPLWAIASESTNTNVHHIAALGFVAMAIFIVVCAAAGALHSLLGVHSDGE